MDASPVQMRGAALWVIAGTLSILGFVSAVLVNLLLLFEADYNLSALTEPWLYNTIGHGLALIAGVLAFIPSARLAVPWILLFGSVSLWVGPRDSQGLFADDLSDFVRDFSYNASFVGNVVSGALVFWALGTWLVMAALVISLVGFVMHVMRPKPAQAQPYVPAGQYPVTPSWPSPAVTIQGQSTAAPPSPPAQGGFCMMCGRGLNPIARFCTGCGHPVGG